MDHSFGRDNYHYVLGNINDELIKDIYKKLGPFDHFVNDLTTEDENAQQTRSLRLDFDQRKSGAMFRGQQSI